ncbi:hypothetical protein LCGC14_2762770, partial [marine sediment metagenome]
INKRRAREGYVTAFVVNENKNIDIRRVQIEDSTFKLGDSIHSLEEEDIYFYKGKPLIIQAKTKLNPFSYFADYNTADNQTYGEKYVLAKLEAERIKRRTNYDTAMIREIGYCNGIENYSRHGPYI